jgi:hypothetical protein
MASEMEWSGFASLGESGIREALDAAGVDCAMPGWSGAGCDAGYDAAPIPGHDEDGQPIP